MIRVVNKSIKKYEVDAWGTEEILGNSCAPTLDIDYGNEILESTLFKYRPTKENLDTNISGIAELVSVKGNTVKWNQLVQDGNFISEISPWGVGGYLKYSINNGIFRVISTNNTNSSSYAQGNVLNTITNHKYAVFASLKYNEVLPTENLSIGSGGYDNVGYPKNKVKLGEWFRVSGIFTRTSGGNDRIRVYPRLPSGIADNTVDIDNVVCFNLTLIYGEGNEPSTAEEFEADYFRWFGKPLTYEPYDTGSLRPVLMNSIKTVGFNQCPSNGLVKAIVGSQYQITGTYNSIWESDEEEVSFVSYTYGDTTEIGLRYSNGNGRYICNSDIATYSNTSTYGVGQFVIYDGSIYKCSTAITEAEEWDASKWTLVADISAMVTEGIFSAMNITPDSNGLFIPTQMYVHVEGGSTDTCVHLTWSGTRNGEYEPYKEHVVPFDVTQLSGKLNGEGDSVVVFPDGMKRVNDVFDEIVVRDGKTWAIKRVQGVDLGSLTWTWYQENKHSMWSNVYNSIKTSNIATTPNLLMIGYISDSMNNLNTDSNVVPSVSCSRFSSGSRIVIRNVAYSDLETFAASLQGVSLYYELANPREYLLDGYDPKIKKIFLNNNEIIKAYKGDNKVYGADWYGIKWCEETNTIKRIGNTDLHKTLPILSLMRRCTLNDDGTVYKYISDSNPLEYEDGTIVNYDGTDGQIMVEIPEYYHLSGHTIIDGKQWNYIKLYPNTNTGVYSKKYYLSAFELTLDSSTNSTAKGCSVSALDLNAMLINSSTTVINASDVLYLSSASVYRNYNYNNIDTTSVKCSYGRPRTGISGATFRTICKNRGTNWSQLSWGAYNSLLRLYFVEYANFNSLATFNSNLTSEGYKQGGLGNGVTNVVESDWSSWNSYNPFIPCGVTIGLGNTTGIIGYHFADGEWKTGSELTTYVPSYRGIENPFGHIWKFIDGFNRKGVTGSIEQIYICNDVNKFAESAADEYELISETKGRATGNIGGIVLDSSGTFWPKPGGHAIYSDYFYNAYTNNTWYSLFAGGFASNGARAGLLYLVASHAASYSSARFSGRLQYTNQ